MKKHKKLKSIVFTIFAINKYFVGLPHTPHLVWIIGISISPSFSRVRMFFTMPFYAHVVQEGCWGLHLASIYGFLSSFFAAERKKYISLGFIFLLYIFLHLHHNNRKKNMREIVSVCEGWNWQFSNCWFHTVVCMLMLISSSSFNLLSSSCLLSPHFPMFIFDRRRNSALSNAFT